jgi:hypothetical protein
MRSRIAAIVLAAVATGLIVGVVLAGSDDSPKRDVTAPELTVPSDSGGTGTSTNEGTTDRKGTTDDSSPGQSAPDQQAPSAPSGGTPAPPEDTPQTDTPPPAGSPASRFERFCEQNPGAC